MFDQLCRQIEFRNEPIDVFFRDDDADSDLPQLRRLIDCFGEYNVPLNLAVIPGTLTEDCADLLRAHSHLELHQHGWMHSNHETEGRKNEFGCSRTYEQQFTDIERGRQRLTELLGCGWPHIFTPPWNRCSEDTCRALTSLAFLGISRDSTAPAFATRALPEVSTNVDIFHWKNGRRAKSIAEIADEFAHHAGSGARVGILLHHKVMDSETFGTVDALLHALRASGQCHFRTLTSAMKGGRS